MDRKKTTKWICLYKKKTCTYKNLIKKITQNWTHGCDQCDGLEGEREGRLEPLGCTWAREMKLDLSDDDEGKVEGDRMVVRREWWSKGKRGQRELTRLPVYKLLSLAQGRSSRSSNYAFHYRPFRQQGKNKTLVLTKRTKTKPVSALHLGRKKRTRQLVVVVELNVENGRVS